MFSQMIGERLRQRVDQELRTISNDKMTVYNTVQLAKEIEVHKKTERSLIAQVEQ